MFTSLAANNFVVAVVTHNHFEPGAYWNITRALPSLERFGYTDSIKIEPFTSVIDGYNASTNSYEDLTLSECTKLYNTDYMSSHRNLFLITKHSSNTTHNNTLLDMIYVTGNVISPSSWMCTYYLARESRYYVGGPSTCSASDLISNVRSGLPWRVRLITEEEVEIGGCKSERTAEKCRVQFSLSIMIVVICCNLVKACCMVIAVIRSRDPTLVTLGDAVDSFLRIPDPITMGLCFADRQFIEREWRRGSRTTPKQWKQKGVKRWWTSVSNARWITCKFFCSVTIITAVVLLRLGIDHDGVYQSTDLKSM